MKAATAALETRRVELVLPYVPAEDEAEVRQAFELWALPPSPTVDVHEWSRHRDPVEGTRIVVDPGDNPHELPVHAAQRLLDDRPS